MGQSPFDTDKAELLRRVLDRYNGSYRNVHQGNQQLRCINQQAHPRGDRNPSASVNLGRGVYKCFSCDLAGDGYALMMALEGMGVLDVNSTLNMGNGSPTQKKEFVF